MKYFLLLLIPFFLSVGPLEVNQNGILDRSDENTIIFSGATSSAITGVDDNVTTFVLSGPALSPGFYAVNMTLTNSETSGVNITGVIVIHFLTFRDAVTSGTLASLIIHAGLSHFGKTNAGLNGTAFFEVTQQTNTTEFVFTMRELRRPGDPDQMGLQRFSSAGMTIFKLGSR